MDLDICVRRGSDVVEIVVQKYSGDESTLLPDMKKFRHFSPLWRNITKPLIVDDVWSRCLKDNMGYTIGNGCSISFWNHEWIPSKILRHEFLRIFALAVRKEGMVNEFGFFSNQSWIWEVPLRREVFNWESGQWNNFMKLLDDFQVCPSSKDMLVWSGSTSGEYFAKSFCLKASSLTACKDEV
ncbi:hypothetical protein PTKIN_Ptkin08bG0151300 [Pterospermum kingtungense]